MRKIYAFLLCALGTADLSAQVNLTATGGTTSASYATLGAAFAGINAGTHTGVVTLNIAANTTEAGPCVLHSSGAGSASYTSVSIRPSADGVTISGSTTNGRGLIELNGADNVTIDGDNAGTSGTNRNLTITNTAATTVTYASVIRIATSSSVTSADNNTIKNCIINGSSIGGNVSGTTSATSAFATSWGIYAGGNGGTSATTDPSALSSTTTNTAASGQTITGLTVDNNLINTVARGVAFMGGATSVSSALTITNNTIGSNTAVTGNAPYTAPTSTVYVKGILVYGTNAVTVTGNTIQDIISYIATDHSGVELNSNIGSGTISVANNTITNISVNTGNFRAVGVYILNAGGPYTISGNVITNMQNIASSSTLVPEGIEVNTSAASGLIEKNKITKAYNNNTGAYTANGIYLNGGSNITVQNNFISDINVVSGNGVTSTSFLPSGIKIATGTGHRIYYNTIHFFGAQLGGTTSNGTACLTIVGTGATGMDVRNNIFSNQFSGWPSGSVHACILIPSTVTSSYNMTCNNNAYFAPTGNFIAQLSSGTTYTVANFNATSTSPSTNWRAFSSTLTTAGTNDNASLAFTTAPPFTSSTDLHIPAGTSSSLESAAAGVSVTSDIDNQTRPGPAGSTYGGGVISDIGADEFDGIPVDITAPSIVYTPLSLATCATGDRTLTGVTITDASGVPTSGLLMPRIYFRKNSGTWYSNAGSLTSGTGTSGTWSFTVTAATMGGLAVSDVVSYYIIAQDVASTPNITANPGTGLVATNVNTVTTHVTTPNTFSIGGSLGGTYTVGTSGAYPTITAAVNAYNAACLTSAVTFVLTDATYSTSETFPILINNNSYASSTNTLTIRPATGVAVTVTSGSSSAAVFKLLNSKYVTIDGVNTGGSSLSLVNGNTGSNTADVWLASTAGTGPGNSNVSLLNMTMTGGSATTTTNWGIVAVVDGTTPAGTNGPDNDNITIQGNTIKKVGYAVYAAGVPTTATLSNWVVKNNMFGPTTYSATDNLGYNGMFLRNMTNPSITGNTISNVGFNVSWSSQTVGIYMEQNVDGAVLDSNTINTVQGTGSNSGTGATCGIYLGGSVINTVISRNKIASIYNLSTSGYGSRAIIANTGTATSNVTIRNNFITDVVAFADNDPIYWPMGISVNGCGGFNIYFNSINLYGPHAAYNSATRSSCIYVNSGGSNLDIRNNILVNSYDNTTVTTDLAFSIYSEAANTAFSSIDYNDYYVSGTPGVLGYIGGTNRVTLSDIISGFGGNTHSLNTAPSFVSATDLHLQAVSANVPLIAGVSISGVTTDIDGTTRSGSTPVIGAHEVNIPICSGIPTAGTVSGSVLSSCSTFNSNLSVTGSTTGIGIIYQWQSSPDNISFTDISGATNLTFTATVSATTFYRRNITCTLSSQTSMPAGLQLTLNTPPAAITGAGTVCPGGTLTLVDGTPSGTWSSGNTSIATVGPTSGVVTGVAGGGAAITYTIPNGCIATTLVQVSPAPPMTVSASPSTMCSGNTSTLSAVSPVTNYSVYTTAFAPVSFTPTGTFAAGSTVSSGSLDDGFFTVAIPFDIKLYGTTYPSGTNAFIGTNGHLAFGAGITTTSIGTIPNTSYPSADIVLFGRDLNLNTAGTITYGTTGTAPNRQFIVSINAVPDYGTSNYETGQLVISETTGEIVFHITTAQASAHTIGVQNAGATLAAAVPGHNNTSTAISNSSWSFVWPQSTSYTWTPATDLSSATIPNPISSTSTTVTYSVTGVYNGCSTTVSTMVSVNPSPAAITGTFSSCVSGTSTLVNTTPSGVWSSSNATVASVSTGGVVTANTVGTAIISYTANSCSSTIIFTVNAAPGAIAGPATVCNGLTATLTNPGGIGSWTSSDPTVATVGATSGIVTGVTVGTTLISYINGCGTYVTRVTSVIAVPSVISGPSGICLGSTGTLTNAIPGGTWSSGNTSVATINSSTGVVSTVATGLATISYDLGNGCPVATQTETISNLTPPLSVAVSATNFCAPGVSNMTATSTVTNYTVNPAVFAPVSFTPTGTFNSGSSVSAGSLDDGYFTVSLPFAFNFYGTTYPAGTSTYISTNGNMTFGTGLTTTSVGSLPTTGYPYAMVSLYGRDLDLRTTGSITYGTTGTAPNRQFIVSYNAVPVYGSSSTETGQVVLNESTGEMVFHITNSEAVTHTMGVQNVGGTTAAPIPGHNSTSTAISNSSWSLQWPQATSYTWSPATFLSATTGNAVTASGVTSTTTYTVSAYYYGCATTLNTTLTVNTTPAAIADNAPICESNSLTLTNTVAGGTWESSNTSVATVDPTTGLVNALDAGLTTVSYTITSSGCRVTDIVTVNARPADITGTASVCVDATTSLTSTPTGGTWSSTTPAVATVSTSGVVSGEAAGLSTISYMLSTGCFKTRQVTVNPLPVLNVTPATAPTICEGQSTSFTASSPLIEFPLLSQDFNGTLGSWTIDNLFGDPANVWQITSAPFSGASGDGTPMLESAPSAGASSAVHTILTSPSFSTMGFGSVMLSFNQDLTSYSVVDNVVAVEYSIDNGATWSMLLDQLDIVDNPGTWTASAPQVTIGLPIPALNVPNVKLRWNYDSYGVYWNIDNIAVKGALPVATFTWAGSGSASEISCPGCATTSITPTAAGANVYSVTASSTCSTTSTVTVNVNALPVISGGASLLCTGKTIALTADITGGTWVSGDNSKATVDASTGVVTGVASGAVVITYTAPTTCAQTVTLNVNLSPSNITGALHVCETLTTALGNFVGGGTWISSDPGVMTVNITSGLATGVLAGNSVITYTLPSGCLTTSVATVDQTPTAFTGSLEVCEAGTTTLSSTPTGGTWVSTSTAFADVDPATGVVSGFIAGTTTIVYTLATGCERSEEVTVNPLPANITGTADVCEGLTTTLANTTPSGTWSSSNLAVGTVDAGGVVAGIAFGTTNISYTITATGCYKTKEVTVNALPDLIGGSLAVCEASSTTLTNTATGGTWVSSNSSVATIDLATGVMSGVAFGTTNITYTLATGCLRSAEATVNALPDTIAGPREVCQGLTVNLTNATSGGTWSSDDLAIASVDAAGMVTGNLAGTANILYTLTATGCARSVNMTVNQLPSAFGGSLAVCEGSTSALSNTVTGGTWTSSAIGIADVDLTTGVLSGIAAGNANITYTLATGCLRIEEATVNALPSAITGTMDVCKGLTTTLINTTPAGTWSNDLSGAATVDAAGVVTGVTAGTSLVSYTITSTGCYKTAEVTVNALPEVYTVTGGGPYCMTTAGIAVGLSNSQSDVNYDLYMGTTLMGSTPGTGAAISFGLQSVVGTYAAFATNTVTGCVSDMAGTAVISTLPLNIPSVTLGTPATTVCSGIPITYTATPVNGGTLPVYDWEINGVPVSGVTSATYSYSPANGDIVKVTLNSNEICAIPSTATDLLTMTVNTSEMPVATISVPTTTICAGSGASFSVVPTFGGTTPSYEWYVNYIPTGVTSTVYTYVPANGDVVTANMASNFTCRLADTVTSNALVITTTPIVLPIVSLAVSPSAVFTSGTAVTFTAILSGVAASVTPSYQWIVNNMVIPGATTSTYTSSTLNNNDSVTCKVNISDPCGFENFNSIVVRVKTVGVSQLFGQGNVMLIPNPNSGAFSVKGKLATEADEEVFVEVLDMIGQVVFKATTTAKSGVLNEQIKLSNTLANGMYMLNLRTATEAAVFHFVLEQ